MTGNGDLETLIDRIGEGDREAFAALYDATSSYVYGLLLKVLDDREKAEEVAQRVYTQVWRTAASFDGDRSSPLTWIAMIARSRAIDRTRSDRSRADTMDELEGSPDRDALGATFPDPEEAASLAERRQLVRAAMEDLPPEQRDSLMLAFFRDLSHREIADRTDTPLGTVKSRIRSGLQKLEDRLDPVLGGGKGGAP